MYRTSACCGLLCLVLSVLTPDHVQASRPAINLNGLTPRFANGTLELSNVFKALNISSLRVIDALRDYRRFTPRAHVNGDKDAFDDCTSAYDLFLSELLKGSYWALLMIDSSSFLNSGLFAGNLVDLGAYDECLSISVSNGSTVSFRGQHCMITMEMRFGKPPPFLDPGVFKTLGSKLVYTFSLCVPSTCTAGLVGEGLTALQPDLNFVLRHFNISLQFMFDPNQACHTSLRPPWSTAEVTGMSVSLFFIILVIICSSMEAAFTYSTDHYKSKQEKTVVIKVVKAFSIISNGRKLLSTRVTDNTIQVLHSLRFFGIAWVCIGHRVKLSIQGPLINLLHVADIVTWWSSMVFLNAPLSVDIFFVISGILNTYTYMSKPSRSSKTLLGHLSGYVHRFIRLTPAYAMMVLVTATWLYRVGDGPLWDQLVGKARSDCTTNWWTNILYINNYYNTDNFCMMQSWYLAADMQLFWISPIVLYSLWRWPRLGHFKLVLFTVIAIIIPFVVAFYYEIKTPILISFDTTKVKKQMAELYFPTHTKAVSYFIGMAGGYVLYLHRKQKITVKFNPWVSFVIWLASSVAVLWSVFGAYYLFQFDSSYNRWNSSLYIALYKVAWCAGITWFIIGCNTGHGGFLNTIFGWRAFAPLGRLTYCIYLTHAAVILYSLGSLREPQYFTYWTVYLSFGGEFLLSILLGAILSLTIEAPMMAIEKLIRLRERNKLSGREITDDKFTEAVNIPTAINLPRDLTVRSYSQI